MREILLLLSALAFACAWQPVGRTWLTPSGRNGRAAPRMQAEGSGIETPNNVLGSQLECCCACVRDTGIGTGFFRDGHCSTGAQDEGRHTVCVQVMRMSN